MQWTWLISIMNFGQNQTVSTDYNYIFPSLCECCNYDGLIVILGLQRIFVEFLVFHLVVSPLLTLATEQITATQVFSTELMFVIPIFLLIPSILDEFLDLSNDWFDFWSLLLRIA